MVSERRGLKESGEFAGLALGSETGGFEEMDREVIDFERYTTELNETVFSLGLVVVCAKSLLPFVLIF